MKMLLPLLIVTSGNVYLVLFCISFVHGFFIYIFWFDLSLQLLQRRRVNTPRKVKINDSWLPSRNFFALRRYSRAAMSDYIRRRISQINMLTAFQNVTQPSCLNFLNLWYFHTLRASISIKFLMPLTNTDFKHARYLQSPLLLKMAILLLLFLMRRILAMDKAILLSRSGCYCHIGFVMISAGHAVAHGFYNR